MMFLMVSSNRPCVFHYGLWSLTPFSTIFQLYHGGQLYHGSQLYHGGQFYW